MVLVQDMYESTRAVRSNSLLPYHLATPQHLAGHLYQQQGKL